MIRLILRPFFMRRSPQFCLIAFVFRAGRAEITCTRLADPLRMVETDFWWRPKAGITTKKPFQRIIVELFSNVVPPSIRLTKA